MSNVNASADANGGIVLSVWGGWGEQTKLALETIPFVALTIGDGMGGFSDFEPYAEKIRWLKGGTVRASEGLEKLKCIERIDAYDVVVEPQFDYRRLPQLRAFSCKHAGRILLSNLNHENLESLDLSGATLKDLRVFSKAKNLRAIRLATSPIKSLAGIEGLEKLSELRLIQIRSINDISDLKFAPQLELLELEKTPNISDVSSIYALSKLRWLFIDGRKAKQNNLNWIRGMPDLECASIWVETEVVDWSIFAEHPRLYDVAFYTTKNLVVAESDQEIIAKLSAGGRRVKSFKRFPKDVFPAFAIEFYPSADIISPMPRHWYQNQLRYTVELGTLS